MDLLFINATSLGFWVFSMFCCAVLCVLSSFAIILSRLLYFVFLVALPHGAAGWSAVCDCGIS